MQENKILSAVFLCFFAVLVSVGPNFWKDGKYRKPKAHHKTLSFLVNEQQCFNAAGLSVGPAGPQYIKPPNSFVGTTFERKGDNCECSFVSSVFQLLINSYCINFRHPFSTT
jgi:hypothetical protein